MAADATHGQVVQAAGNATVVEALIGAIELPARGSGWRLHNVMGQVARATATAAELIGGHVRLESASGDLDPDPAPSRWPVYESASFLGATADVPTCALHNYPIDFTAAGKANINLNAALDIAATVAPKWVVGVSYSPDIPAPGRYRFCDRVRTTVTAAARTQIGTISLSEKATRITGIFGSLMQDGVLTTAEELVGFFDLASDDVDLVPSQWMFNEIHGAGLGVTIEGGTARPPAPHIVDIPVIGGARIDVFVTPQAAVTNGANVCVYLMYE